MDLGKLACNELIPYVFEEQFSNTKFFCSKLCMMVRRSRFLVQQAGSFVHSARNFCLGNKKT